MWDSPSHTGTCAGLLTAAVSGQHGCAMGQDRGAKGSRTQHAGTLERTGGESSRASRLLSWGSLQSVLPVKLLQSVCRPHSVLRAPAGLFADVQSREQSAADAADVGRAPLHLPASALRQKKRPFHGPRSVLFVTFFCVFSSLIVAKSIGHKICHRPVQGL